MSQNRKQSTQLSAGDRFVIQTKLAFEVVSSVHEEGGVVLQVRPTPCGDSCPTACDCHTAIFRTVEGEIELRMSANSRPEFLGNLTEVLETVKRANEQIKRLKTNWSEAISPSEVKGASGDI